MHYYQDSGFPNVALRHLSQRFIKTKNTKLYSGILQVEDHLKASFYLQKQK